RANLTLTEQNERIYQQNQEIARQKDNIELSNIELMRKNELIEKKNDSYQQLLKELNEKNTYLTHSIRYAEKIQRSFLPHNSQFKDFFNDHFVIFKPKDVVSGDFYWLSQVENQIFLAVVDCTGHGVPGAFMSMIGNTLLNEIINQEKIFDTNQILEQLHDGVRWSLKQNNSNNTDGMDIALCRVDIQDANHPLVQFSGAKRSLYYVNNGKLGILAGDRKSIGGWQKETQRTFSEQKLYLRSGDRLYFHTDGYTDAPNSQRKKIGRRKMESIIHENLDISLKEQGALLLYELYQHKENTEQRDDITFIGVEL
ncbi:MAG: SpoIIE family protein phosphatase, partial [Bacteroidota bacterium]